MLTVTDEAPSLDLATLASVKAALGIVGTDEDAKLKALITAGSAAIQAACNRVLVEEGIEETFRGARSIMLSRYPVSELTQIAEDGSPTDTAAFELDPATGIVERLTGRWGRTVIVSYISGYPLASMPPDVVQALVSLVAHYRSTGSRDPLLRAEETTDIERLEYFIPTDAGLPGNVQALIASHRKMAGA